MSSKYLNTLELTFWICLSSNETIILGKANLVNIVSENFLMKITQKLDYSFSFSNLYWNLSPVLKLNNNLKEIVSEKSLYENKIIGSIKI